MKRLSDYKDDEAIELWGELLEPISVIFSDSSEIMSDKKKTIAAKAKAILKAHPEEVKEILLIIDDTPVNGLNILFRLIALLQDFEDGADFFTSAEQERTVSGSTGSPMGNTEADEQ